MFFYLILTVIAIVTLFPLIWTIYASFLKTDLSVYEITLDPHKFGLNNYHYILTASNILQWYRNSVIVTGAITLGNILFNTMAGYTLARIKIPGRKFLFLLTLGVMMVPPQVLLTPTYILLAKLGWINTLFALIIPFIVNPFGVFLMRQFFLNFPRELEEAAKVDGLSRLGIFCKIAFPLARTGIIAQAIIIFVWNWNSFMFPSILVMDPEKFTLPLGIYQITRNAYVSSITRSMSGVILMIIPVLVLYFIFQKQFLRSIVSSGIK